MRQMAREKIEVRVGWLRAATLGLLGAYGLLSLYVLWRTAVLTPYSDELDWIRRWWGLQSNRDWATYLLAPDNLHRLPWTFGLLALDIRLLGGTNVPLILSGALSLAAMACALGREAGRAAPPPLALPAAALAVMLVLMAGAVLDAATPICVDYTHGAALAVIAIVLAEGGERTGGGWRRAAALAFAMASALGDAAALAVWPVLACGALRRREWRWLAAILLVGGVFVGLYASGQGNGARSSTIAALQDPAKAARLSLSYLCLPWAGLAPRLAWAGGLLVALTGAAAVLLRAGAGASRSARVAGGLVLFSLGTALMAGLGRAGLEDPATVPLRYAVFMAPLQAGLLILALPYVGRAWRTRHRTAEVLIAGVLLLMTTQDVVMATKVVEASDVVRETLFQFQQGRRTPEMLIFVHPDLERAQQVYADLRRADLFQHELHLKAARPAR